MTDSMEKRPDQEEPKPALHFHLWGIIKRIIGFLNSIKLLFSIMFLGLPAFASWKTVVYTDAYEDFKHSEQLNSTKETDIRNRNIKFERFMKAAVASSYAWLAFKFLFVAYILWHFLLAMLGPDFWHNFEEYRASQKKHKEESYERKYGARKSRRLQDTEER
ncbi:hypothetical protein P280DRAFT_468914 [Massarina eburnea CBS 473.64]|uniref:Uncharacterized protein n=1 Tax=Massarina eburnea CBS 473.64 TaxID=1395130 RepID=A0A6A6S186_9PLEO|nr:hypothetical protein P280DRAFT_468914 [Massarina eburnea CBS 473.64]